MTGEPAPHSLELWAANRQLAAEQEKWPAGKVEACEELEKLYPGWRITWLPRPHGDRPPGYYAHYLNYEIRAFGATVGDLAVAIDGARLPGEPRQLRSLRGN